MSYVSLIPLTQAAFNALKTAGTPLDRPVAFFITDAAAGAPNIVFGRAGQTPTAAQTAGAVSAGAAGGQVKNNFAATTAPAVSNDGTQGYAVGSRWVDTTGGESYICVDASTGAAVWSKTTVGTIAEVSGLQAALDLKAPLASPALTGTPTVPTAAAGTNTTQAASTAFVTAAQAAGLATAAPLVDGTAAVGTSALMARQDHVHPTDTTRAPLASPTFTGTPTAPTAAAGTNTTQLATTAFVQSEIAADLATAAPLMDGTAAVGTSTSMARQDHVHPSDTSRQATLVSGTNIKTVNSASILGTGNVAISSDLPGGTATTVTNEGMATTGSPTIDTTTVPGETIVTFTATGTFTPPNGVTSLSRVLGVGGGGSGGRDHAGGGGGGFTSELTNQAVTQQSYALTVGAGGVAMTTNIASDAAVHSGKDTSFGALFTWQGGGAGGGRIQDTVGNGAAPLSGGPGGGGAGAGTGTAAGTNPRGAAAGSQGFAGGNGNNLSSNAGHGGGGGGAGGVGGNSTPSTSGGNSDGKSGDGGIGILSNITGTSVGYGGGGAGGRWANGATAANLGTNLPGGVNYGGGPGEGATDAGSQNGLANRGGGGGGGGDGGKAGGNGGSGVIIIRFPTQTRSYQALSAFASDSAAATGGILIGQFYRDSTSGAVRQRTT